jgi:hypothetical protein
LVAGEQAAMAVKYTLIVWLAWPASGPISFQVSVLAVTLSGVMLAEA